MKALFVSFLAADYDTSVGFYRNAAELALLRNLEARPHRFINFDLGELVLKVFEWTDPGHSTGHSSLFIETESLDDGVVRIRHSYGETMAIVNHGWGGCRCTVRDPFSNLFDLIEAHQTGDT